MSKLDLENLAMEVQLLPIGKVRPNPWNPNEVDKKTYKKIKADIKRAGFVQPILARPVGDSWEVVDGEHRYMILSELGAAVVPAIVREMTDEEAKRKTIQLNYMRGAAIPIKLAALLHDLHKTMTLKDLEASLPYTEPELQDSLALLMLPNDIEQVVERQAKKERASEPIYLSAIVHKDKERGLFEFVEQALLETEATFAEVKIKVECPAGDYEAVIRALANLARLEQGRDDLAGEKAPIVIRFAVFPEQADVIDQALQSIIKEQQYTKNARGMALEMMAADYLAGAPGGEWPDGGKAE